MTLLHTRFDVDKETILIISDFYGKGGMDEKTYKFFTQLSDRNDDKNLIDRVTRLFNPKVKLTVGEEKYLYFINNAFIPYIKVVRIWELVRCLKSKGFGFLKTWKNILLINEMIFISAIDYIVDFKLKNYKV